MCAVCHRSCIRFAPGKLLIGPQKVEDIIVESCSRESVETFSRYLTQLSVPLLTPMPLASELLSPEPLRICRLIICTADMELDIDTHAWRTRVAMEAGGSSLRRTLLFSRADSHQPHCGHADFPLFIKRSLYLLMSPSVEGLRSHLEFISSDNAFSLVEPGDFCSFSSRCPV